MLEIITVAMEFPADANIIVGQSHFIKTGEDLYEAVCTTEPQTKFVLAFSESSGASLARAEGNDGALCDAAIRNVCSIFCATADPTPCRLSWRRMNKAGACWV